MSGSSSSPRPAESSRDRDEALKAIAEALKSLQYGSVTVTVQDGIVVQIDRTEKRRLIR